MDEETRSKIKEVQKANNYPGLEKLLKLVERKYKYAITRREVKEFLAKDIPTQLYATQQKVKSKGHIVAYVKDELWQIDIFVMKSGLAKYNDGYRYIFVCIDVFSRKAYGEAMKSKDTESCLDALQHIIDKKAKARPRGMLADQDAAFQDKEWQKVMTENQIAFTMNALKDHKALGIIDNFARVMKSALNKFMEDDKTYKWMDYYQTVIDNYNKGTHSSIGNNRPDDVKKDFNQNEKDKDITAKIVGMNVDKNRANHTSSTLEVGDKVRKDVRVSESNFKGTDPRWSDKVFTVASVRGDTITLDDGSKYKRENLLKVPADTQSTETNMIQKIKNQQRKEKRQERIKIKVLKMKADERAIAQARKKAEEEAKKKAEEEEANAQARKKEGEDAETETTD
jgi:transposase InsO family protein